MLTTDTKTLYASERRITTDPMLAVCKQEGTRVDELCGIATEVEIGKLMLKVDDWEFDNNDFYRLCLLLERIAEGIERLVDSVDGLGVEDRIQGE